MFFVVNVEHVLHFVLVFLLMTFSNLMSDQGGDVGGRGGGRGGGGGGRRTSIKQYQTENSQLICFSSQLNGFYTIRIFTETYLLNRLFYIH